jgi:hypothetical protein
MVYHNNVLSLTHIVHHDATQTRYIQNDSRVNARHRSTPRFRNQAGSTTKLGENDASFKGRFFEESVMDEADDSSCTPYVNLSYTKIVLLAISTSSSTISNDYREKKTF